MFPFSTYQTKMTVLLSATNLSKTRLVPVPHMPIIITYWPYFLMHVHPHPTKTHTHPSTLLTFFPGLAMYLVGVMEGPCYKMIMNFMVMLREYQTGLFHHGNLWNHPGCTPVKPSLLLSVSHTCQAFSHPQVFGTWYSLCLESSSHG